MKYIEELAPGDCFIKDNAVFLLTTDFKNNGNRLCIDAQNGNSRWIGSSEIVELTALYQLDKDNNVVPIKHIDHKISHIH